MTVSARDEFNAELQSVLAIHYMIDTDTDAEVALERLVKGKFYGLIIDYDLPPNGGLRFLERVRSSDKLKKLPVIMAVDAKLADIVSKGDYYEGIKFLVKPFNRKELLEMVSSCVNEAVEQSWEILPQIQKTVLKETVSIFQDCFQGVQGDQPVPVAHIESSCSPLVEAVESDQVTGLLSAVQAHDDYTYVHSLRVAIYLSLLGHHVGMKGDELLTLSSGGLMHDLGKSRVPHDILNKPARLDEDEFVIMKTHVTHTKDIFDQSTDITKGAQIIALQHHEKLDGTGYPLGLKGSELNILARMSSIVDIYGALTDRRVYKPAMPAEKAISIMEGMSNELDMVLLDSFKEFLMESTNTPE